MRGPLLTTKRRGGSFLIGQHWDFYTWGLKATSLGPAVTNCTTILNHYCHQFNGTHPKRRHNNGLRKEKERKKTHPLIRQGRSDLVSPFSKCPLKCSNKKCCPEVLTLPVSQTDHTHSKRQEGQAKMLAPAPVGPVLSNLITLDLCAVFYYNISEMLQVIK